MDVAVLLNLTSKLTFEITNPLMSIINAGESLLYYDRLSVEQFPADAALYQQHIERLASSMRNLLEARSLSPKDNNEKIRLIVTLDLANGAFNPENTQKFFPAQRVRQFKHMMETVFEEGNPLLKRFDYVFIFIASHTGNLPAEEFYKTLAYDGYMGSNGKDWFCWDDLKLNEVRNTIISELKAPDDSWQLTDSKVKQAYNLFDQRLHDVVNMVSGRMEEVGLKDEFTSLVNEKMKTIVTIRDFNEFDYDGFISSCISQLIGLSASDFRQDSTFFIVSIDNNTAQMRCNSEVFIASLIQFLVTLDTTEYDRIIKPNMHQTSARLFVKDHLDMDDIDGEAFLLLERLMNTCLPQLDVARWRLDLKVENCLTYFPKAQDTRTTDTHHEINDNLADQRQKMSDTFKKIRKVPFFFGKSIGDWSWYKNVVRSAEAIYHFESVNDRPLYDLPKRITDNEIEEKQKECTYAELENEISLLAKETIGTKRAKDLNNYLKERGELLENYGKAIEHLKKEMVKLGFFTCLLWMGIFMILGFTLTYAYHFFWYDSEDSPWLIVACGGVAIFLFILSAVIGQSMIKSRIKTVYAEMDSNYQKMQDNLQGYLDDIAANVELQKEADIRRKNLDEMNSKMDAFYRHNKQIDIWVEHYRSVIKKLLISMEALKIPYTERDEQEAEIDDGAFEDAFPVLPYDILHQFSDMSVMFSDNFPQVSHVTSFVNNFRFVIRH